MKIRALVSFAGAISMYEGEEREYDNKVVLSDLLKAGYIKEVEDKKLSENSPKEVKKYGRNKKSK